MQNVTIYVYPLNMIYKLGTQLSDLQSMNTKLSSMKLYGMAWKQSLFWCCCEVISSTGTLNIYFLVNLVWVNCKIDTYMFTDLCLTWVQQLCSFHSCTRLSVVYCMSGFC